jgi:hypothetical protein
VLPLLIYQPVRVIESTKYRINVISNLDYVMCCSLVLLKNIVIKVLFTLM